MKKSLKVVFIILISFFVIIIAALIAVPKLIPGYVEENSQAMLGRRVSIEEVRINYFRLELEIFDFVLYEENAKDAFVSFDEFSVNLQLIPSLRGNYTIASMLLDNLNVNVEFDGEHFNFDDLIVEADTTAVLEEPVDTVEKDIQFTLNNIELRQGDLTYYDSHEDIRHELSNIGFVLPHFAWDNDESSEMDLAFKFEPQGVLQLKADVDYTKKRYKLTAQIIDLALAPFSVYLESMLASQGIEGLLNNTIYVNGSMDTPDDIVVSGELELSDFSLYDDEGAVIFENGLLGVYLDSIDLRNNYFGVSKVLVSDPSVYAVLYDTTTNFDQLLKPMTDAALGDTLSEEEETVETSTEDSMYFQIDTFLLDNGSVYLTDNSLNRPFKYSVTSIHTDVAGITPLANKVPVNYSMVLNKVSQLDGNAAFSMLNSEELEYAAQIKGLNLTSFSPYSEFYVARPITRGNFYFKGKALMSETNFKAENQIQINDIEMGAKTTDKAKVNIPVKLALGILKDKNGDVKFDVPMEGDPSDPDFNVGKIIGKTLTDFVIKVASAPFAIVEDIAGVNPERLKEIPLVYGESDLHAEEIETMKQIALALNEKPELVFHFVLEAMVEKEKEALAINYLKKDYLNTLELPAEDLEASFNTLKLNDEGFVGFVNAVSGDTTDVKIVEKCMSAVGDEKLNLDLISLESTRKNALQSYLLDSLKVDPTSIGVRSMDVDNNTTEIKKSRYRVEVSVK